MKPTKDATLRARVESGWKSDLESFARAQKLDVADIVRLACTDLMQRHNKYSNLLATNRRHGK